MASHNSIRILVIEDDDPVRQMLDRALRTDGYDVVSLADIPVHPNGLLGRVDLVVTNARMPYLSGDDLIGEIHRHWPGVPILHLDDLTRPLSSSMPIHVPSLMKPFSIESLLLAVEHLTTRGSPAGEDGRAG
jgi:DNA-binding response OmpR family regulator